MRQPIGFFDSGVGGLSVLRVALEEMPEEEYLFYGDSANAPYGEKSPEQVRQLTDAAVDILLSHHIKALVIACNTATSVCVEELRQRLSIPVLSMEPAIKPALEETGGEVLLLATPVTVASQRVQNLIHTLHGEERVILVACDRLASLVEQNRGQELEQYLEQLLAPYRGRASAAVLGCTHYPFASRQIASVLGGIPLYDGSRGTVHQLRHVLETTGTKAPRENRGSVTLLSSREDPETILFYQKMIGGTV